MSAQSVSCYSCKHVWTTETALGRRDECPNCHHDAKVCLNCRYFDRGAHHECREEQAEWVKEKDRGNFCSYFYPKASSDQGNQEIDKAKQKLAGLFGGGGEASTSSSTSSAGGFQEELKRFLASKKP